MHFPPKAESYCYLGKESEVNHKVALPNWTIRASPILESKALSDTDVASVLAASNRVLSMELQSFL